MTLTAHPGLSLRDDLVPSPCLPLLERPVGGSCPHSWAAKCPLERRPGQPAPSFQVLGVPLPEQGRVQGTRGRYLWEGGTERKDTALCDSGFRRQCLPVTRGLQKARCGPALASGRTKERATTGWGPGPPVASTPLHLAHVTGRPLCVQLRVGL